MGDLQPDETVDAVHESSLLRNLDHPGIVKFQDSFIDENFFCIVTEFCEVTFRTFVFLHYMPETFTPSHVEVLNVHSS